MPNTPKFDIENVGDHIVWKQPAKRMEPDGRYDWEAFYLEVIRFMRTMQGTAMNAEALQDHMRHWCLLTWRRCPTEALLRDKLDRACLG